MKTTLENADMVHEMLNVNELRDIITGAIYHINERPADSNKEDVVIAPVSASGDEIQRASLYVIVYAPDLKLTSESAKYPVPDRTRLSVITSKIVELLKGHSGRYWPNGVLKIGYTSGPHQFSDIRQHCMRIRVEIRTYNRAN